MEAILANKVNTFTKEALDAMEVGQLESIAALAVIKPKDFRGNVGAQHQADEVEVLEAPTFDDYAPKAK